MALTYTVPPSLVVDAAGFPVVVAGATPGETVTLTRPTGTSTLAASGTALAVTADGSGVATFNVKLTLPSTSSVSTTLRATGGTSGLTVDTAAFWVAHPRTGAHSLAGDFNSGSYWMPTNARYVHFRTLVPNATAQLTAMGWRMSAQGVGSVTFSSAAYTANNPDSSGTVASYLTTNKATYPVFTILPALGTTAEAVKGEFIESALWNIVAWYKNTLGFNLGVDATTLAATTAGAGTLSAYSAGSTMSQHMYKLVLAKPGFINAVHFVDTQNTWTTWIATDGLMAGEGLLSAAECEAAYAARLVAAGVKVLYSNGGVSDSFTTGTSLVEPIGSRHTGVSLHPVSWAVAGSPSRDMKVNFASPYRISGTDYALTTGAQATTPAIGGTGTIPISKYFTLSITANASQVLTAAVVHNANAGYSTADAALIAGTAVALPAGEDLVCLTLCQSNTGVAFTPGTSALGNSLIAGCASETRAMHLAPANNKHVQTAARVVYRIAGTTYSVDGRTVLTLGAGTAGSPSKVVKATKWGAGVVFADAAGVLSIVWDNGNAGVGYATDEDAIQSACRQTWPTSAAPIGTLTVQAPATDWTAGTTDLAGGTSGTGGTVAAACGYYHGVGLMNYFGRAAGTGYVLTTAAASATQTTVTSNSDRYVTCIFGTVAAAHSNHTDMEPVHSAGNTAAEAWLNAQTQTAPTITLTPSAAAPFTATVGDTTPQTQTFAITNTGTGGVGALTGLAASVSYVSGSGWLAASLDQTFDPATLTVTFTPTGLAAGTVTATVSVSTSLLTATNSPQTIAASAVMAAASAGSGLTTRNVALRVLGGGYY